MHRYIGSGVAFVLYYGDRSGAYGGGGGCMISMSTCGEAGLWREYIVNISYMKGKAWVHGMTVLVDVDDWCLRSFFFFFFFFFLNLHMPEILGSRYWRLYLPPQVVIDLQGSGSG